MDRTGESDRHNASIDAIESVEAMPGYSSEDEMIVLENAGIRQKLRESGVIGRVLNDFMPCLLLKIIYQAQRIYLGRQVLLAQVQTEPVISCCFESEPHGQHVIVMTDPDAPGGEYLHWLVSRIVTDQEYEEVVAYEPPRTAGHMIVFTMFRIPESQDMYVPILRENFSTRDFADMNGFGRPLSASFFYIKHENEKNWNGVHKCPTHISNEGPSPSKIACAIPSSMGNRKISLELCKPKEFKPMVLPSSVEKQKGDDGENGGTGRREENHSTGTTGTCSTAQISCKSEDDDSPGKQSEEESTCPRTLSSPGQPSTLGLSK